MTGRRLLLCTLAGTLLFACTLPQLTFLGAGGPGWILYQPIDEEGLPTMELVVVDPDGAEQHRIHLSDEPGMARVSALPSGNRAIVTAADRLYLVDAAAGSAQELELPEQGRGAILHAPAQFRLSGGGDRWTLLGNPQGDLAFLVDLETGEIHDLTVPEEIGFVFLALFSPDEDWLVYGDGWLVSTDNLDNARRLGEEQPVIGFSFSSDSRHVAYSRRTSDDEWNVVVERVDGTDSEVVASSGALLQARFVPDHDQLVIDRFDPGQETTRLSLLSLDDGSEQDLLEVQDSLRQFWFSPDGQQLLAGSADSAAWYLIDLKRNQSRELDDLAGYQAYYQNPEHHWLLFVDSWQRTGERQFYSLDLESGETKSLLSLGPETQFWQLGDFSSSGSSALAIVRPEDGAMQLWELWAATGEAYLLAQDAAGGALSPDGSWVAVATMEETDAGRTHSLTLMTTDGGETVQIGAGINPVWLRP